MHLPCYDLLNSGFLLGERQLVPDNCHWTPEHCRSPNYCNNEDDVCPDTACLQVQTYCTLLEILDIVHAVIRFAENDQDNRQCKLTVN